MNSLVQCTPFSLPPLLHKRSIGEKMTLLESRLGQTERRIEREMTQIHGKMDDVFRNLPDKS